MNLFLHYILCGCNISAVVRARKGLSLLTKGAPINAETIISYPEQFSLILYETLTSHH